MQEPTQSPTRPEDAVPSAQRVTEQIASEDAVTNTAGAQLLVTHIGATLGGAVGLAGGLAASAASGAAAGTLLGGPAGAAIGLVVGAVIGGLAAQTVTEETVDAAKEEAYWREHYRAEPYYQEGDDYAKYGPAYRTGYLGRGRYINKSFEEAEAGLQSDYDSHKGDSTMTWEHGKHAARSAWDRVGADHHGRQPQV